jgi:branched-chain amino acid aminotransferase
MEVPLSREEVVAACRDVVKKNGFSDGCYLRPIIYIGTGAMGIAALSNPVHVSVAGWRWGAYLGEEGVRDGIRTMISSYRRGRPDTFMAKGKICGQYVTSILAKREALKMGFEEAIMLDTAGLVAEGTGENIFVAKNGVVRTPCLGSSILGGITRETSLQLLGDQGVVVKEEPFTRDELYTADEIFMTGTAAEVTPVREVDGRAIGTGKPGPITKTLQEVYAKTVRGELPQYASFIDRIEF